MHQAYQEVFVILEPHTIDQPVAVVVHLQNADPALSAVVRPDRFEHVALFAYPETRFLVENFYVFVLQNLVLQPTEISLHLRVQPVLLSEMIIHVVMLEGLL